MKTYVVVGGVAGGATAAARLRRRDETARIIILERGPFVSFANCGLPYHIGELIQDREALLVSTPEKLAGEFNIDVRTNNEVLGVDPLSKSVSVRNLETNETYNLPYDKLVLSPGATAFVPPIPGVDLPKVYTLRTIPDMDVIKAEVDQGNIRHAVIVGGGFIGLEVAENLIERGVEVSVVEMLNQVMTSIDFDMAALVHDHIKIMGVHLGLGDGLAEIQALDDDRVRAVLSSGKSLEADMVILAIGVKPSSELAKEAGLEIGPRGHIVVNDHMQTSNPDIYAVGDAIQVTSPVTDSPTAIPLAGPANRQARIAADHITGAQSAYRGTWGTAIVKVFDIVAASVGLNSHSLNRAGIAFKTSISHSYDHVSYYPGATSQAIKLLYAPETGRLLGAQVVGYNAIDRSIDALAVAMQAGMTVFDLEHLELAYAPPFGAAKDPVNIAGFVASNDLRGDTEMIEWDQIDELDSDKYGILDVREDIEWELGNIPGAVHIENNLLRDHLDELDKSKTWVLYCSIGRRAYVMERMMRQRGFSVLNLSGGWRTYALAKDKQSNLDEWDPSVLDKDGGEMVDVGLFVNEAVLADTEAQVIKLNACGLQCPGPILAVYKEIQKMNEGDVLEVEASDPGFRRDIAAWADRTGNKLVSLDSAKGTIRAVLQKGQLRALPTMADNHSVANSKTMVVFSADLDRALAAFIIANGAAAMGQDVTMFFTFWGLNILRRDAHVPVKKNLVERMFGWMMPRGANRLKLSNLNMGGMGTAMMKAVMQSKNIDPLPSLIASARENGVKLIACQMTMDMMGIKEEELIDGIELGGVATYISETDKGNASLFI